MILDIQGKFILVRRTEEFKSGRKNVGRKLQSLIRTLTNLFFKIFNVHFEFEFSYPLKIVNKSLFTLKKLHFTKLMIEFRTNQLFIQNL